VGDYSHSLGLIGTQVRPRKSKSKHKVDHASNDSGFSSLEKKVIFLCSKGDFSKAYSALFPSSPATLNDNTLDKLANLHPPDDTSSQFEEDMWSFVSERKVIIPKNLVREYIHKSDHFVGPGPSFTTIDLFKAMMGSPSSIQGAKFVPKLTYLQNIMANEKLPDEMTDLLKFSTLNALDNEGGKVRLIAMSETLRKMNASLVLKVCDSEIKEIFKGAQFGMESMGTEKIIHSINHMRGGKSFS
jgi:hypothetical protein